MYVCFLFFATTSWRIKIYSKSADVIIRRGTSLIRGTCGSNRRLQHLSSVTSSRPSVWRHMMTSCKHLVHRGPGGVSRICS